MLSYYICAFMPDLCTGNRSTKSTYTHEISTPAECPYMCISSMFVKLAFPSELQIHIAKNVSHYFPDCDKFDLNKPYNQNMCTCTSKEVHISLDFSYR